MVHDPEDASSLSSWSVGTARSIWLTWAEQDRGQPAQLAYCCVHTSLSVCTRIYKEVRVQCLKLEHKAQCLTCLPSRPLFEHYVCHHKLSYPRST